MKTTNVTVTALKAPWPEGVTLGSVVAFKGEPPAWALGKFNLAPEGVKADFAYQPPELAGDGTGAALPSIDAINADIEELRQQLTAAQEANDKLTFEKAAAEADAKEARQQLTAAQEALAAAQKKK